MSDLTEKLIALRGFLSGSTQLDGVSFGDRPINERGAFWWRKHLSAIGEAINELSERPTLDQANAMVGADLIASDVSLFGEEFLEPTTPSVDASYVAGWMAGKNEAIDALIEWCDVNEAKPGFDVELAKPIRDLFPPVASPTAPPDVAQAARVLSDALADDGQQNKIASGANWGAAWLAMGEEYRSQGWTDWPAIFDAALRALISEGGE